MRTKLQVAQRLRDLALFNLAIDSKLRGCDLVSLKFEDIVPHGFALDPPLCLSLHLNPTIRAPASKLDSKCRIGSENLRHPFAAAKLP